MKKELLTIEFRYNDKKPENDDYSCISKTITIGIYDTLNEAVKEGNKTIGILSKHFEVRRDDKFKVSGLFGMPDRLVTNCCYTTKGVSFFAEITSLNFDDLETTINEAFVSSDRYKTFIQKYD